MGIVGRNSPATSAWRHDFILPPGTSASTLSSRRDDPPRGRVARGRPAASPLIERCICACARLPGSFRAKSRSYNRCAPSPYTPAHSRNEPMPTVYRAARFEGKNRTFEGKRFDIWGYIPASCGTRLRDGQTYQAADIIFPAKSRFFLKHSIFCRLPDRRAIFPLKPIPKTQTARSLMLWRLSADFGVFRRFLKLFE